MTDLHVVWADDVETERWALVAGVEAPAPSGRRLPTTHLWPWPGSSARGGRPRSRWTLQHLIRDVDRQLPTALTEYRTGDGVFDSTTVVVAAPEDRIEVSLASGDRRLAEPSRESSRNCRRGTAWRSSSTRTPRSVIRLCATASSGTAPTSPSDRTARSTPFLRSIRTPRRRFPVERLRDAPPGHPGDAAAPAFIADVLAGTGLPPDQVAATVLWAGDLPSVVSEIGPSHRDGRAASLRRALRRRGSRTGDPVEGPFGVLCGSELRAAGPCRAAGRGAALLVRAAVGPAGRRPSGSSSSAHRRRPRHGCWTHKVRCSAATRWWTAWPSCPCRTTSPPSRSSTPRATSSTPRGAAMGDRATSPDD